MRQHKATALWTAGILAIGAVLGFAYARAGGDGPDSHFKGGVTVVQSASPQPDTSSSNWMELSDDLGVWISKSDRGGLRGRLYARRGDSWVPVAIDGAADITSVIPVR